MYVDGFVLPIAKSKVAEYTQMATEAGAVWKKHGALQYVETILDDPRPEGVEWPFAKTVQATDDETVGFAFIVYESRAHRDEVNKKVMADPAMTDNAWKDKPMPMDMKRMAFGGFEAIVQL